jgi:hypothetical protein
MGSINSYNAHPYNTGITPTYIGKVKVENDATRLNVEPTKPLIEIPEEKPSLGEGLKNFVLGVPEAFTDLWEAAIADPIKATAFVAGTIGLGLVAAGSSPFWAPVAAATLTAGAIYTGVSAVLNGAENTVAAVKNYNEGDQEGFNQHMRNIGKDATYAGLSYLGYRNSVGLLKNSLKPGPAALGGGTPNPNPPSGGGGAASATGGNPGAASGAFAPNAFTRFAAWLKSKFKPNEPTSGSQPHVQRYANGYTPDPNFPVIESTATRVDG